MKKAPLFAIIIRKKGVFQRWQAEVRNRKQLNREKPIYPQMLMQTVKERILTKMDVIAIIISIAALAASIYVAYTSTRGPPEDIEVNSKTISVDELPDDFESKEKNGDYSTKIDNKVEEVEKERLPDSIAKSFKDGEYRTVVTTEPITLYRVYGGKAEQGGTYCSTEPCVDRDKTKNDLALKSSWGNTMEKEAEIVVPAGTKLNIGRVEAQNDNGKLLKGDADQILLPLNWDQDWVNKVRDID